MREAVGLPKATSGYAWSSTHISFLEEGLGDLERSNKPVSGKKACRGGPAEAGRVQGTEQAEVQTTSPFSVVSFTLLTLATPDPNHCDYWPKGETQAKTM